MSGRQIRPSIRSSRRRGDRSAVRGRAQQPADCRLALHARRLARRLRKKGRSLCEIAARLAQKGFVTIKGAREGQPYLAQSIKVMLGE